MPLPSYRYGKVSGTYPDLGVVSERSEEPMVCCGYCSAHMACITAKAGLSFKMQNEAHAIRSSGGRPHNKGSRASELRAGASGALGITLKSVAIADIPGRLQAGYAVVIAIQYAKLPAHLKVQTNDFGHSATLFGWNAKGEAGYFDPLWNQGAQGAWTPWAQLPPALWGDGNHSTTTVKRVPASGGGATDMSIAMNAPGAVVVVPEGGAWFLDSARTQFGAAFGPTEATYVGWVDNPGNPSRAVEVVTGIPYGGTPKRTIVYVSGSYAVKQGPPIVPPKPPDDTTPYDEADLVKAKQEGYDLALSVFPPRP